MNEKVKSGIRNVVAFLGGLAVSKGWLPDSVDLVEVGGSVATLVALVWGVISKNKDSISTIEAKQQKMS